jgi:hypothetical protein
VGALGLGIELGIFLDIPLEVDALIGLGMVFVNINDVGTTLNTKPHHIEDLIFH